MKNLKIQSTNTSKKVKICCSTKPNLPLPQITNANDDIVGKEVEIELYDDKHCIHCIRKEINYSACKLAGKECMTPDFTPFISKELSLDEMAKKYLNEELGKSSD